VSSGVVIYDEIRSSYPKKANFRGDERSVLAFSFSRPKSRSIACAFIKMDDDEFWPILGEFFPTSA